MSLESNLTAILKASCPRVFPDVAPPDATVPYVTYQGIGGESLRYTDGSAADKRHVLMQISVWSATRAEAIDLVHGIEDALCAAPVFTVDPQGEAHSTYEEGTQRYGSIQRFEIWATR